MSYEQFVLPVKVTTSHSELEKIAIQIVESLGFSAYRGVDSSSTNHINLVIDIPMSWAFHKLSQVPLVKRRFTVVSTMNSHPVYHDCLKLYRISGVFESFNYAAMFKAVSVASFGEARTVKESSLTRSELRVIEMLIQGRSTCEISAFSHVNERTVNSHVSNVLGKLHCHDRAQLVAKLLGNCLDTY